MEWSHILVQLILQVPTARTQFFNTGGQIRFSASRSGGSGSKNTNWTNLLSAMGTVIFDYTSTAASFGTGSSLGGLDLSTSYQQIFIKTGSGNYAENDYNINARYVGNNIQFRIQFRDDDAGDPTRRISSGFRSRRRYWHTTKCDSTS